MTETAFNFWQHWYPIAPVMDLDVRRPMPIMLLGQRFVVWNAGTVSRQSDNGQSAKSASTETNSPQFRVFRDQCPHRLAPLSEGRVDEKTGHLMCSYHGWQFDAEGVCTRIPQADNPEIVTKNRDAYCVAALPTQVANGLLWVWPDAESAAQAHDHSLPLSEQIDAEKGFVHSSMVRDLAYDWQTLIENVADPAHVQFAHHGLQGNRDRARPIPIEVVKSTPDYIEVVVNRAPKTRIMFEPPCRLEYEMQFDTERQVGLIAYCVPVAPGQSRIVAQFSRNFATQMQRWSPRWLEHLRVRHPILDGDMILLHEQERFLHQRHATETWKTAYRLPTQSDRLVIEFRRWLDRYAPLRPWGTLDIAQWTLPNRQQLLDRYHQHTLICSSCRSALQTIQRIKLGLLIFCALAIAIAALTPDAQRLWLGLPLVLLALLALAGYGWLKYRLEPQFYFVDYVHADR